MDSINPSNLVIGVIVGVVVGVLVGLLLKDILGKKMTYITRDDAGRIIEVMEDSI